MSCQVVKENQILHKGDRIIDSDNEDATLVDVNIFAGDQIIVRDSEIHENRDIAGKLFASGNLVLHSIIFLLVGHTENMENNVLSFKVEV